MPASVAEQASLSLTWSETPEDKFSDDEVHIKTFSLNVWGFTELLTNAELEPCSALASLNPSLSFWQSAA